MRRPIGTNPARTHRSFASGALTPQEAASRLARLEFDVVRLEREIASTEQRVAKARSALARNTSDREALLKVIAREPAERSERH